jgi:hypothetical protein
LFVLDLHDGASIAEAEAILASQQNSCLTWLNPLGIYLASSGVDLNQRCIVHRRYAECVSVENPSNDLA